MINIGFGGYGNMISTAFFEAAMKEHSILPNGCVQNTFSDSHSHPESYFQRQQQSSSVTLKVRYMPRYIAVDSSTSDMDRVRTSSIALLLRQQNLLDSNTGYHNLWISGRNMIQRSSQTYLEAIRREFQISDHISAFQFMAATGGGSSGALSCLSDLIYNEYPQQISYANLLVPSSQLFESPLQSYNTILALAKSDINLRVLLDNSAILKNWEKLTHEKTLNDNKHKPPKKYTIQETNRDIVDGLLNLTSAWRFSGTLNASLRKIATNLVIFPAYNYVTLSCLHRDIHVRNFKHWLSYLWQSELTCLSSVDLKRGRNLAYHVHVRGPGLSEGEIQKEINSFNSKNSDRMIEQVIPKPYSLSNSSFKEFGGCFLNNNTDVRMLLEKVLERAEFQFKRKSYWFYYSQEGMEELEFQESCENLLSVKDMYNTYNTVDPEQYVNW